MADELENVVEESEDTPVSDIPYPEGTAPPEEDPINFDPYIEDGVARGYDPDTLYGAIVKSVFDRIDWRYLSGKSTISELLQYGYETRKYNNLQELLAEALIIPDPSGTLIKCIVTKVISSTVPEEPPKFVRPLTTLAPSLVWGKTNVNGYFPVPTLKHWDKENNIQYSVFKAHDYPAKDAVIVQTGEIYPVNTVQSTIKYLDSMKFSLIASEQTIVPAGGVVMVPATWKFEFKPAGENKLTFDGSGYTLNGPILNTISKYVWKKYYSKLSFVVIKNADDSDPTFGVYAKNDSDQDITVENNVAFLFITSAPGYPMY